MSIANFHTHSGFCDGEGNLEQYVAEGIKHRFQAIGFSSHAPLPFYQSFVMRQEKLEDYCAEVRSLQIKYQDRIQIYLGLESDYIPGVTGPNRFKSLNLDYIIGSVHIMKTGEPGEYICLDESDEEFDRLKRQVFGGNMELFARHYYNLIRSMVKENKPDVVGHLDVIKKFNNHNKYFDEEERWYKEEVLETLRVIADSDAVVEVNTGGIARGYIKTPYPSPWILQQCRKLDIPIILNSDAHSPKCLNVQFAETIPTLKEAGYTEQRIMLNGIWQNVGL